MNGTVTLSGQEVDILLTIYDISKMAGVSIATVSRVLNESANVRPDTRRKVLEVMEQSGYTPNAFARGLGLNSMQTIGILCTDSSDLYLAKAVYYIEQDLRAGGYHSILCCTGYRLENKKSSLELLLRQKVDSVILVGSNFIEAEDADNQYIRDAAEQVPIMLLNAYFDHPNVFCSLCDDLGATQQAALSLIDSGIPDILYLYNSRSYSARKKLAGFQSACQLRGLPNADALQQFYSGSSADVEGICRFISSLHDGGLSFRAVIASDDVLATAAVKYARLRGQRIPSELSVIGYNNSILALCCEPELTSVDNRLEEISRQLVKTLIGTLNGIPMPAKTVFPGRLVQRGTTALPSPA